MADLVDEIAKDDNPEELDDDDYDDLKLVLRSDIPVADGEDRRRAEIKRVEIFPEVGFRIGAGGMDPIIGRIEQGAHIEKNGEAMCKDEKIYHQVDDLELVLVYEGKFDDAEVFVVFPCLQV